MRNNQLPNLPNAADCISILLLWCSSPMWSHTARTQLRDIYIDTQCPEPTRRLASALLAFSEEQTAFAELEDLKHVISEADAAARSLPAGNPHLETSLRLLLLLLVQGGSRLLHRHLLSFVRRLPEDKQLVAGAAATTIVLHAAQQQLQQADACCISSGTAPASIPPWARPALCVVQAAASLAWLPQGRAWLAPAAVPLLRLAARGAAALLRAADAGLPLSPQAMEQLQETITLVIFLLVNHGRSLAGGHADPCSIAAGALGATDPDAPGAGAGAGANGAPGADASAAPGAATAGISQGQAAVIAAADAMLLALRSHALVREAMASAVVAVWHAVLLPAAPPAAAAVVFARGLGLDGSLPWTPEATTGFEAQRGERSAVQPLHRQLLSQQLQAAWVQGSLVEQLMAKQLEDEGGPGAVEAARKLHGSCVAAQLAQSSPLGRVCALKGLLTALPIEALCSDVSEQSSCLPGSCPSSYLSSGWCLLIDGALPATAAALESANSSHYKFHSAGTLGAALQRCSEVWQQMAAEAGEAAGAADGGDGTSQGGGGDRKGGGSAVGAAALMLPWVGPALRAQLMGVMWPLVDEPVAQTLKQVIAFGSTCVGLGPNVVELRSNGQMFAREV